MTEASDFSYRKREAELFLTIGRILKYLGFILAFAPILVSLPGMILLITGREMFSRGETLWNELYRLPKRWVG